MSIADGAGACSALGSADVVHVGIPVSSVGPDLFLTGAGEGGVGSTTGVGGGTGSFSAWIKWADPFVAQTFPPALGAGDGVVEGVAVVREGIPDEIGPADAASVARGLASGDDDFGAAAVAAGPACSAAADAAVADGSGALIAAASALRGSEAPSQ